MAKKNYMRWWKAGGKKVAGKKKGFHKKDSLRELDRGHQIDARGGNLHSFATGPEWAATLVSQLLYQLHPTY